MVLKPFVSNVAKGIITKDNVKDIKKEMSKLASMANKRISRLEKAGLENTPSYQKWIKEGALKFGVKGKDHNQLQKELTRLKGFINSETSTIKGVNNVLKEMAQNTGISYKNLTELRSKSGKFFELSSKVEQYIRSVDDIASAIGYQKIWQAINTYTKDAKVNLANAETDIDSMIEKISELLVAQNSSNQYQNESSEWWFE